MVYITYTGIIKHKGKFTIEFYERECGDIPVEEFLLSLNVKMRAKLVGIMKILQEKGNLLREPYSKHLDDGKIVLTNGFVKKTQKTPKVEIDRAKTYRDDYLERCDKNEKI